MTPTILLRIAAILTLLHFAGHTLGGVFGAPTHGSEELAVLDAMKSHRFDFMGSARAYWDFYFGFALFTSVNLLLQSVLFWQLATLAKTDAARVRPMVALFFCGYVAFALLSWRYFFAAPLVGEIAIAACLGLATAAARPTSAG